jgi:hypothetical protein
MIRTAGCNWNKPIWFKGELFFSEKVTPQEYVFD